jgi:integrase
MGLQWQNVDLERKLLRLPDSKTGAKVVFLNAAALEVIQSLPRLSNNLHVIPGARIGAAFVGLDKIWVRVRASAGLDDVRLHDLRHSFASVGASDGLEPAGDWRSSRPQKRSDNCTVCTPALPNECYVSRAAPAPWL